MKITFIDALFGSRRASGEGHTYEGANELEVFRALKADNLFQAELSDEEFLARFRERMRLIWEMEIDGKGDTSEQARAIISALQRAHLVVVEC